MSLPPILQTALSAAIDGAIIEVFAEKATDKVISILKNHFLSAAEINHALQDSYALALATISAGLAAADQKKAFLQKLTQSKLKREFTDQIETHYLPSFQTLQPANFNLPAFRADAVKQCKALIPHQKQLFTAESEFTDADLAAIISYKGSLAITDNILKQLSPLTEVDDTLSTFLSHQELLGNAILFFFTEQLRRHPRVKDTFAALQRAGLWVDVRDLKAAQQKLQKTLEQQQTEIGQQLTEQKQLMADAMATNQFSRFGEIGQTLQQLQQQADAIENNLQQLPKQLQQAQAVWQQSYQQLSQLTEQFQTWLPLIDEKLADVLTGVEELMPLVKDMDDKLDKIQDHLAIIKQKIIANPQLQEQKQQAEQQAELARQQIKQEQRLAQAEAEEQKKGQLFSFEVITVNANGQEIQREPKSARCQTIDIGNGVTLDMVYIPGGTFMMGSPETEAERYNNEQQHQITIEPFYMAKYLVTQAQWRAIMGNNPSRFKGNQRPVEKVSFHDSVEFCQRLSDMTGNQYHLPSEAQWEYACRAGTTTPFYFGPTITTDLVNYRGNSYGSAQKGVNRGKTTDVGSFPPNAFGLYDMHGTLLEWTGSEYQQEYQGKELLSLTKAGGSPLVLRGGAWFNIPRGVRAASRDRYSGVYRSGFVGVRLVQSS